MQESYIGYIYITKNLVNGKKYIGQHKAKEFDKNYFGSGKLLKEALNKYGKDNFECNLVEWCTTSEQLNEREIYWIKYYNAVNDDMYYNLHDGGGSGWDYVNKCWSKGLLVRKPLSEQTKINMRKPHKVSDEGRKRWGNTGKHLSASTKNKLSNAIKLARATYAPIWNKGLKLTNDTIKKIKLTQRQKIERGECNDQIVVKCVENGYIFFTISDAIKWLGINSAKIYECINGSRSETCGYHWEMLDKRDVDFSKIDYSLYDKPVIPWKSIRNKLYKNIELNLTFKNYSEIMSYFKYNRKDCEKIKFICDNNLSDAYKEYHWKYVI